MTKNGTDKKSGGFLLEARGICKSYGALRANDGVDLRVRAGGRHALIGENGAGKSTLVNILYGAVQADAGSLKWRGESVRINSPQAARKLGVGIIFQHFALFESMSVAENIRLGLRRETENAEMLRLSEKYGLRIDPAKCVGDLSVGEKQRVEILRSLLQEPRLLILDEPTSVLTPAESRALFVLLRRLADEGRGILFISHKLREVEELCEEATVLRGGRTVFHGLLAETTRKELIRKMIGAPPPPPPSEMEGGKPDNPSPIFDGGGNPESKKQINSPPIFDRGENPESKKQINPPPIFDGGGGGGDAILCVKDLHLQNAEGGMTLRVPQLQLKKGVITGVAGIAGNGQDELLNALSGETITPPGSVLFCGEPAGGWGVARRCAAGILTVPTERRGRATVGEMSLAENALLGRAGAGGLRRRGFIFPQQLREEAAGIISRFDVAAAGADAAADSLSGGNLQKYIVGRALMQKPAVLIAANPTWGVDVRAAAFVRREIMRLREGGGAVLVISEDLDELFELCDEIAVINCGALSLARPRANVGAEDVGRQMTVS